MSKIDLSLIIPCYNEESTFKNNVKNIFEVLDCTRFNYEVIFVDDNSQNNTREIIIEISSIYKEKKISKIFHKNNAGRGSTVTDGIKSSEGETVGFIDVDLSTSAIYIPALVLEIKKGADIATALRVYKLNWFAIPRWVLSKGYKLLVKIFLKLDLKDTETGCKFFNKEKILPILNDVKDNHWFWDTEIMVRSYIKGLRIIEIPTIFIRKGFYSRVKIFSDSINHLINLIKFRRELKEKHFLP